MAAIVLLRPKDKLTVVAGKRHKTMGPSEWNDYQSERGKRGKKLPRGYQKVDAVEVIVK